MNGNASAEDEVWNRTDPGIRRLDRFLFDAVVLCRIQRDSPGPITLETVVGCDVGQYIGIGNILPFDEVCVSDCDCEPVLRVKPCSCQDHGMSSLSRIGPELAAKIQVEARSTSFSFRAGKGDFWIGDAVARAQQVRNVEAVSRRIRQQQDWMLPNVDGQVGKTLRQHFIETVMPDEAPRACDFSIKVYLHNYVLVI